MFVSRGPQSALPHLFEERLVPELIKTYGEKRPATVRVITPNYVPKHTPGRWKSPHPGLVFDIRSGDAFPQATDLKAAAPADITFLYVASRDRLHGCLELAHAVKATHPDTRQILVACGCNHWHVHELEAGFGPMIWTQDCGGNAALDEIIETLVRRWPTVG